MDVPPVMGVATVMAKLPAAVRSLAGIAAVSCVLLTNVVVRLDPFQRTTEPAVKPVPATVRVKPAALGIATAGLMAPIAGGAGPIVNVTSLETIPAVETPTRAVAAALRSAAVIAASNCELLTKVVLRAIPFHSTVELPAKFAPFTLSAKAALPAVADGGTSASTAADGLAAASFVSATHVAHVFSAVPAYSPWTHTPLPSGSAEAPE